MYTRAVQAPANVREDLHGNNLSPASSEDWMPTKKPVAGSSPRKVRMPNTFSQNATCER